MSVILDDASSQYLYINDVLIGTPDYPFTIAGWYKSDATGINQTICSIGNDSNDTSYLSLGLYALSQNVVANTRETAGDNEFLVTTEDYSTNIWQHAAIVHTANNSRAVYMNGGYKGTSSTQIFPYPDRTALGCLYRQTIGNYFSGKLAEVAIWDIALSEAELAQLAGGAIPSSIASDNLLAYWPLISDGNDSSGNGKNLSASGSPTYSSTDHPLNTPGEVTDKTYSRKLIAIGNNELWYESSAGTMTELSDANGEINTGNPLFAVEAYQKLFIVNKTNLKVADFINTKINTADAGANPCTKGMTLIGGTSNASMIVDYVDGVTDGAAANVYGYRTTTATFSSGETVTGTNADGNAVSFATSAAETAPPHWYDWTVFGNDTTNYGTMPTSSSIIGLYRGRVVYNDDLRPYAWYMTAVENPWKIYSDADDGDLRAVTYTNTTVGEVGDIITAIIPYKDDLLIWGCANSIWILVGDPMGSGQNARITNKTGIWGSRAWCIDDKNNLYFLGDDGIYKMPISESYSPPQNISKLVLPNLITDLDLDKSLHRVVLGFDPIKYGIHICKTLLSDGTNTNYWFDLMTGGFYPETYPTSCGVFSSYYYPATDDTYKKYLIGCDDGYIREFDNLTENDATTSSTSAIDSYCTIVGRLSQNEDTEGKMTWINAITSGGASGGDFSDSDSVEYGLYAGDAAETVLEDIKDGATAFTTGTWDGSGKQTKNRTRMRGAWYGIKIGNNDASETWSLNTLYINVEKAGKLR